MTEPALPTILVVEDEVFVRIVAADMLTASGFKVLEAGTADEALRHLADNDEVAVLFTDVNMPGPINGLALAAQVASTRPEIRIVVTSGREWLSDAHLPCQGKFLPKPYRPDDLVQFVGDQVLRRGD